MAGVLGLHTVIHLIGFLLAWRIAEVGEFTFDMAVPAAGTGPARVTGVLWLCAAALFGVAAGRLASGRPGWALPVLAGAATSTPVLLLDVGQTLPGLVVNLALAVIAVWSLTDPTGPTGRPGDAVGSVGRRRAADPDAGFGESELAGLPEPVARYFRAAVAPGAPLARAAVLDMHGSLKLGGRWLPMRAREVLAPHEGVVWRARVAGVIGGADALSDGRGTMRWTLLGILPVMSADGPDVTRSIAARAAGEAVWVPTSLLPRFGVRWEAPTERDIVAHVEVDGTDARLHLRVDEVGHVQWVRLDRWGDPEQTGRWGHHPFGFQATATRTFGPYTIPSAGSAGWFHGTDGWTSGEFFRCEITDLVPLTTEAQVVRHDATAGATP